MHKILGMMLLIPVLAVAQIQPFSMSVFCGPTETIVTELRKYNERITWAGKEADNTVVTMWQSVDDGTYSVVKTTADGQTSCLISSGKIFTPV